MSSPDLNELMQRAREMQEKFGALQQDLARRSVEGSSGAGLVHVVMSGDLRVQRIEIDPNVMGAADGDREMLQDLIAAAVNAAIANAQQMVQQEMQKAAAGSLPLGPAAGGAGSGGNPMG